MHMHTHVHQMMVTEINKTINFWGHFILLHGYILDSNPIHRYNVFLLKSFIEAG